MTKIRKLVIIGNRASHVPVHLGISKRPGARGPFWARLGPMALARPKPERPKPDPSPLKGGPGRELHFRPGPAQQAGPNHGLLGPPRGPPKSPPRGPPISPFRSPPIIPPRGPPKSPPKSPFIGSPRGPSKSPLKSPPKNPTPPCRFFI